MAAVTAIKKRSFVMSSSMKKLRVTHGDMTEIDELHELEMLMLDG